MEVFVLLDSLCCFLVYFVFSTDSVEVEKSFLKGSTGFVYGGAGEDTDGCLEIAEVGGSKAILVPCSTSEFSYQGWVEAGDRPGVAT